MTKIKYNEGYFTIDNRRIYYKYSKKSSPTVLFESGLGDSNHTWNDIQDRISLLSSTFSYDRAGIGKSDATDSTTRSGLDIVEDLSKLISSLPLDPPYLLVGHSFGGLISRLFASIYPKSIYGILLIDAVPENKEIHFQEVLTDSLKKDIKRYLINPELNSERIDKIDTYQQITRYWKHFDFPITIITRGLAECYGEKWPEQRLLEIEQKLQFDFKKLSNRSKSIVAQESGHYIHKDQPDLVIEEIINIIMGGTYPLNNL